MRLNFLWEIKLNELDQKLIVDMIIGISMFLMGAFWDLIAGIRVPHNPGFSWMQILWCVFWGLYVFYTWWYQQHYGA